LWWWQIWFEISEVSGSHASGTTDLVLCVVPVTSPFLEQTKIKPIGARRIILIPFEVVFFHISEIERKRDKIMA
jgi:hypothetical protein